jgi:hypothetical protein
MENMLLINETEFLDKLYQRIELFNIKDRIEDYDTRKQVLIQVMDVVKECDKLKNSKQK